MAAFSLDRTGLLARIDTHIQQAAGTTQQLSTTALNDVDICIDSALTEFSQDASGTPFERIAPDPSPLAQGNGTASLTFSTVAPSWIEGLSEIRAFEHPVDDVPPSYWEARYIRRDATRTKLLLAEAIASGEELRLVYTAKHTVNGFNDEATTTISIAGWPAFSILSAAYCAEALSAYYANTSEASFGADIAGFRTKSQEAADVARRLRARYEDLMPAARGTGTSLGLVNWDLDTQGGGAYFPRDVGAD